MSRPSGGDGATGGESAVVFDDAFQQVAQGLARMQEALQLQGQEAERRLQEATRRHEHVEDRRHREAVRRQEEEAERRLQEAMRRQEEETERRFQEVLRLQEQRVATALRDVVCQMDHKLQEKDDVIRALEQRLEETQKRVADVEGRTGGTAEKGALRQLADRVQEVEVTLQRAMQKVFPREGLELQLEETSPPEAASSSPSSCTSTGKTSQKEESAGKEIPPPETTTDTTSTTPSTAISSTESSCLSFSDRDSRSAKSEIQEVTGAGGSAEVEKEQLERQRVELRMQEVREKREASRANPCPLGEDLHRAVDNGRLADVRQLLEAGAYVNYVNSEGYTPLLATFVHPKRDVMAALLLKRGANVNAVNTLGASAMHAAAWFDNKGRCVDLLVAAGGNVNARSGLGQTPLHWAVEANNEAAVRALLSAGARKDLKGWENPDANKTPFDLAVTPKIKDLLRL